MFTRYGSLLVFLGLIYLAADINRTVGAQSSNFQRTSQLSVDHKKFYIVRIARNWFDANRSCERNGYKLISFNTTRKWNAINNYLDDQRDKWHYWTSGNDFLTLDVHVWSPSGMAVPSEYWNSRQPDNYSGREHCDEFRYKGSRLMNDLDCTFQRYYICELTHTFGE